MSTLLISFVRGHETYWNEKDDSWHYRDNNEIVPLEYKDNRPCIKCQKPPTKEGYDPCMGLVPDAVAACCGHGIDEGYVMKKDGTITHWVR